MSIGEEQRLDGKMYEIPYTGLEINIVNGGRDGEAWWRDGVDSLRAGR